MSLALLAVWALPAEAQQGGGRVPERSEIEDRYKWDLADYYADTAAWEVDFTKVDDSTDQLADLKGTLSKSPENLLAILKLRDALEVRLERVYAYAMLVRDQDTRDPGPQALHDRASSLEVRYREAISWFDPELLALPEQTLRSWCRDDPKLAVYEHFFDNVLRQRRHVLSAREEELLAMGGKLAQAPRQAFGMLYQPAPP